MELVGPRPADHIDVGAGAAAVSCVVISGLHFKLLNGVRCWNRDVHLLAVGCRGVLRQIIRINTIELNKKPASRVFFTSAFFNWAFSWRRRCSAP